MSTIIARVGTEISDGRSICSHILARSKGRDWFERTLKKLPLETGRVLDQVLKVLDDLQEQIGILEERFLDCIKLTPTMKLLNTLPGVREILTIVIEREIGTFEGFTTAGHLAAHAGVVPRVHASGGKNRYDNMRKQTISQAGFHRSRQRDRCASASSSLEAKKGLVRLRTHLPTQGIRHRCQRCRSAPS
jgi:transposase